MVTVKAIAVALVPVGVKIIIGPVVAASGTVAEIRVEVRLVNMASKPLNFTAVIFTKLLPRISTVLPTVPLVGVKSTITNAEELAATANELVLVALPLGVLTVIGPLVALLGTVAKIAPASTLNEASTPLN